MTSGQLSITDGLTIDCSGADRLAVSGNDASRIFWIGSGVAVGIDGLTVTHGRAVGQGGGILNAGTRTVSNDILSDNMVVGVPSASLGAVVDAFGGGIFNGSPSPVGTPSLTLLECLVVLNQAEGGMAGDGGSAGLGLGGGLYLAPGGVATADLTLIFANSASMSDDDVFGILV